MSSGLDGDDALTDTRQLAFAIGIIEHARRLHGNQERVWIVVGLVLPNQKDESLTNKKSHGQNSPTLCRKIKTSEDTFGKMTMTKGLP